MGIQELGGAGKAQETSKKPKFQEIYDLSQCNGRVDAMKMLGIKGGNNIDENTIVRACPLGTKIKFPNGQIFQKQKSSYGDVGWRLMPNGMFYDDSQIEGMISGGSWHAAPQASSLPSGSIFDNPGLS